jgi:hypothetical protein
MLQQSHIFHYVQLMQRREATNIYYLQQESVYKEKL